MKSSHLERKFITCLKPIGKDIIKDNKIEQEYKFHPTRRWRFDFAVIDKMVAIEIDGGQFQTRNAKASGKGWTGGRHNTDADREKMNEAAILGWKVIRFSGTQLDDAVKCIDTVRRCLSVEISITGHGWESLK